MVNKKISELPAVTSVAGGDALVLVQAGVTKQATVDTLPLGAAQAAAVKDAAGVRLDTYAALVPVNEAGISYGDSLTYGYTGGAQTSWPDQLATIFGVPWLNRGYAGWASTDVAVKAGALDPKLTVTGNTIPASGPVTVTGISPTTSWRSSSGTDLSWTGILAGIPGVLTHVQSGNSWSFTRTTPGAATACPPSSPFHCTENDTYRDRTTTIWVGTNNFLDTSNPYDVLRDVDLIVQRLTSQGRRYLVISIPGDAAWAIGSANYSTVADLNTKLAQRYGDRFFDLRRHMIRYGLSEAGVAQTTTDVGFQRQDIVPPSLRADSVHYTPAGYTAIGKAVARKLANLGFITGAKASPSPVPPSLGVTDLIARYNANAQSFPDGSPITNLLDDTANLDGQFITGTPTMRAVNGRKYIDLGVTAGDGFDSATYDVPTTRFSIAFLVYWAAVPAAETRLFGSAGTKAYVSLKPDGTLSMWGGTAPGLTGATAPAAGVWHTVIAVFNGAYTKLYLDGNFSAPYITGTLGMAVVAAGAASRGAGTTQGFRLADAAVINHAVVPGEVNAIHAGLLQSVPA